MIVLTRLMQPFAELVRWGEPWDIEDDDQLDASAAATARCSSSCTTTLA